MYRETYLKPNAKYQEDIKKLDKEIEKIKEENGDKHKIMRLEEQKLIQSLFSNNLGSTYSKFSSPW